MESVILRFFFWYRKLMSVLLVLQWINLNNYCEKNPRRQRKRYLMCRWDKNFTLFPVDEIVVNRAISFVFRDHSFHCESNGRLRYHVESVDRLSFRIPKTSLECIVGWYGGLCYAPLYIHSRRCNTFVLDYYYTAGFFPTRGH